MKTIVEEQGLVKLVVPTTGNEIKEFKLPSRNAWYWYPFNVNFTYKYSEAKGYMYLVKDRDFEGPNLYKVDILKKTKPLEDRSGVMFHPQVYMRNRYIMDKARSLGVPTINEQYTLEDVERGFKVVRALMEVVKKRIEDRYFEKDEDAWYAPDTPTEEYDAAVYSHAKKDEKEYLQEFGEMYTMLCLMRKIAERR